MNNTSFAIAYRRASVQLMDAIASADPVVELAAADRSAHRAWVAASNIIEETLAGRLIQAIADTKPLVMA